MGICQANQAPSSIDDELLSLTLPNSEQEFELDANFEESFFRISQSREFSADPIQMSASQYNLNKLPISQNLYLLYNKCRIERAIEVESGTYIGQWFRGKQCGFGRMFYTNGDQYTGYWFMGMKHHVGVFIPNNKQPITGAWFADLYQGDNLMGDLMKDTNFSYSHLLQAIYYYIPRNSLFISMILFTMANAHSLVSKALVTGLKKETSRLQEILKMMLRMVIAQSLLEKKPLGDTIKIGSDVVSAISIKIILYLLVIKFLILGLFENNQPTTNGISIQI